MVRHCIVRTPTVIGHIVYTEWIKDEEFVLANPDTFIALHYIAYDEEIQNRIVPIQPDLIGTISGLLSLIILLELTF